MMDYRKLCIEIFGTDDETELREIAGRQRSGRKKALSKKDTEAIIEMQQRGKTTKEIAEKLHKTEDEVKAIFSYFDILNNFEKDLSNIDTKSR